MSFSEQNTHEILILGGHFAGLGTAHYLLKHIIPNLSALTPKITYHLTIVCPHTEFFFNIAGPRHIVSPTIIEPEKLWIPTIDALKDYDPSLHKQIVGKAVAVDPARKVVSVETGKGVRELGYSTLVIATGTTSNSKLWQVNEHQDVSKALYAKYHEALPQAKTVFIAGGGAAGIETAGEIATTHRKASITLFSGTNRLLPRLSEKTSARAAANLEHMGVAVKHNVKIGSSSENADGTTILAFSDGTKKTVDVFIDATGGKPNTSYLSPSWLDSRGYVQVDDKTLRTPIENVYAVGDVGSYSANSLMDINMSVPVLGASIGRDIAAANGQKNAFKQKEFKQFKDTQLVPIGPSGGVGQLSGWSLPSWFVWLVKSRTFFVPKSADTVNGSQYA